MNAISIDTLKLRVPPIEYQSPPVCEVTLSGSGFPSIDLEPFGGGLPPLGPLLPPDFPDNPFISFPPTDPQPLCVTIAKDDGTGRFIVVDVCVPVHQCSPLICVSPPPEEGCYKIQVITDIGATPYSTDTICITFPTVETLPATNIT